MLIETLKSLMPHICIQTKSESVQYLCTVSFSPLSN